MIPHLNFNYSWVYDKLIYGWNNSQYKEEYGKKAWKFAQQLQKKWNKIEKRALTTLSEISGLKWKKSVIEVYIVTFQKIHAFSKPLTLRMCKNKDILIPVVIHEMIHNLLVQNLDKIKKKSYPKYGKISRVTAIHILVHAIEKEALLKLFGEKKLNERIKKHDPYPDYKKAWEIVEKEGLKKIIKDKIKAKQIKKKKR